MSGALMLAGTALIVVAAWLLSPVAGLLASGCWCVWLAQKVGNREAS